VAKGQYVAAVFEMGNFDLHWLVLPKFRKIGVLHKALHEDILPHMFTDQRDTQRASFNSEENERYLRRQGFETHPKEKEALILKKEKVKSYDTSKVKRTSLSSQDAKKVKQEMRLLAANLRIVADKLFCAYGDDRHLYEQAHEILSESCDVEFFEQKEGIS
jgi:hypothetical protein